MNGKLVTGRDTLHWFAECTNFHVVFLKRRKGRKFRQGNETAFRIRYVKTVKA